MKGRLLVVVFAAILLAMSASSSIESALAHRPSLIQRVTAGLAGAVTVSSSLNHTCAVTSSGGIQCWGKNGHGELGNGTTTSSSVPVPVEGLQSDVTTVTAGWQHTCALKNDGTAWCWGYNYNGQLGDGTTTTRLAPVKVSGLASPVVALAAGWNYTCAVTSTGGAKCWGANKPVGKLGDGTNMDRWLPVDVSGLTSGVAKIATGENHTCALLNNGTVKCWGYNGYGQLGDGTTTNSFVPVPEGGVLGGAVGIALGWHHSCAIIASGAIKCWGRNEHGQLGDGSTANSLVPVSVSQLTTGVTGMAAGFSHTCAAANGAAKCWGANMHGQLGNGSTVDSWTPVSVSGLGNGVTIVAAGQHHACARRSNGGLLC